MNSLLTRLRPLVIALALPVGGIGIGYAVIIDAPLCQRIVGLQAKVAKQTESLKKREAEYAANLETLAQIQQTQNELNLLVSTQPTTKVDPPEEPVRTESTDSPLSRLSTTLTVLSQHQVSCLASQPGDMPSEAGKRASSSEVRTLRLTLLGSFANMHRAIEDLQSATSGVSIVSMEMEACAAGESVHRWTIVLRI